MVNGNARALVRVLGKEGELLVSSINNDSLSVHHNNQGLGNVIMVPHDAQSGIITLENGKQRKMEFYNGEGYLSQSTRKVQLPKNANIKFNTKQK